MIHGGRDAGGEAPVLRVEVDAFPEPGLLRPAIEATISGRAWPAGPEEQIARAVADHVAAERIGAGRSEVRR